MLRKINALKEMLRPAKKHSPVLLDSDVFLVSYPKSGNTWLRFLLANYIAGKQVDLSQSNRIIPDIHYNPEDIVATLNPRITKSHEPFTPRYRRVVYIVRDGRDVAVSYYFHLKKFNRLPADTGFSDYLDAFIEGKLDGLGRWDRHVDGWLDGAKDLLLVRYEDMLSDTAKVLGKAIQFCKLEFDEHKIKDSVSASSLTELRRIEIRQFREIKELSTSNPDAYFFRKGISGDWRNHFSASDEHKFHLAFTRTMDRVGYGDNSVSGTNGKQYD
jgi:estrone sulfotransferase